jgi:lipid II:glycine glycyltransferase (peptidoglycan interpeptide bridge formation enzyme)
MHATLIEDRRLWNQFVAANPTGHITQTYEWPEHQGSEAASGSLRVGVVDEQGRLLAAMLLVRSRAQGVRAPFFYAPRGPVCADPGSPALPLLVEFARREAKKRGAFMIRAEPNVPQDDAAWAATLRRLGFRPTSHQIYLRGSWVTDISGSEAEILAAMSPSWRRYIRGGAKNGMTIRQGSGEADLDAFYRLLVETGTRDGFHIYPKELFREMLAHYSAEAAARDATAEMALLLGEHEGQLASALTVAVLGEWAWYLHGASSDRPEHRKLRPNHPLQWEAIRWAKARGAKYYDWRTIPDKLEPGEDLYGVYLFKRGFGGYARRVLPTQDLVLRPALYWPYTAAVSLRRAVQERKRRSARAHTRDVTSNPDAEAGEDAKAGASAASPA